MGRDRLAEGHRECPRHARARRRQQREPEGVRRRPPPLQGRAGREDGHAQQDVHASGEGEREEGGARELLLHLWQRQRVLGRRAYAESMPTSSEHRARRRGTGYREYGGARSMQLNPCPLEGWLKDKNTCFPSRSPAKHRAEDNAGDSDEQRLGGGGFRERSREAPTRRTDNGEERQPLEIGEVLPHLRTRAGATSVRCRGRVGGMASGGCRVSEVSRKCLEVSRTCLGSV